MRQWKGKNWRVLAVAAVMLTAGAGFVGWGAYGFHRTLSSGLSGSIKSSAVKVSTVAFAQPKEYPCPIPGEFKSVDLPVGLLCDFYKHGIEHAPPRDPSGVMQRREHFYRAPKDPAEIIGHLSASNSERDIAGCFRNYLKGSGTNNSEVNFCALRELRNHSMQSALTAVDLLELARSLNWIETDYEFALFFDAGLTKALFGSPKNHYVEIVHLTEQSAALWRIKAFATLTKRFDLETSLLPKGSVQARRSKYLLADVLWQEARYHEAADAINAVYSEDEEAGDLGSLEKSDIQEMHWVCGLLNSYAGRLSDAESHLSYFLDSRTEHSERALECLVSVLAKEQKPRLAQRVFATWRQAFPQTHPSFVESELISEIASSTYRDEAYRTTISAHHEQ